MIPNKAVIGFLGFAAIGWIGFIVLGSQKIVSQLVPEVCPAPKTNTSYVFVQHCWLADYSYLNELSQFSGWNIVKKCRRFTTNYDLLGKITTSTSSVVTQIGPIEDYRLADSALSTITEKVNLKKCNPDTTDKPFMINKQY
ncbi:hypothetical protein Cri9333_4878 (plasmid) [Crinalium epipsammum PCC 9333]|uniref:Uncharacterized protein n=1 Tax=Crinalium epipsammum PCC 9333 TaxID=1173022 RepID=K9W639_9CYAN|nr:hypothetical protein [Crinalium epipsammum]AFZ15641.1 hypothetical protein Cri9333_4878 [Crinalium epipsammum PCC 9333]